MALLAALNAAGFLLALGQFVQVYSNPDVWSLPASPDEIAWVHKKSAGRGFFSEVQPETSPARRAEGKRGPCNRALLHLSEPQVMADYRKCFQEKADASNRSIAGAMFAANLNCWCDKKVEDTLSEFGCCDHRDYKLLCTADCVPDCTTPEALQCIKDCPATCLENEHDPEFCATGCNHCEKHMLCVAQHSKKMTMEGHPDHNLVCDDMSFDASKQWDAWKKCYSSHPARTHWHRHNAENYCYCQSDLKAAASKHKCCNSKWGKQICDEQCATAESKIDCDSAEAQKCMNDCTQECHQLYTSKMVPECKSKCFDSGSKCAKYSVCKPVGHFAFDYVCDDGLKPMDNGCCPVSSNSVSCPTLCESGAPHYPMHYAAGYQIKHRMQCMCLGCPSSDASAKKKWRKTLTDDLWKHGVAQLATIAKEEGILGANRKMQELMDARNKKILEEFEKIPGDGRPDDAFKTKMNKITAEYRVLIQQEAKLFKAAGEKETGTGLALPALPAPAAPAAAAQDNGNNSTIIVIAVAGVVGLFLIFGILALFYKFQVKKTHSAAAAGSVTWNDDATNVVMGRPVVDGSAGEAVAGAPVRTDGTGTNGKGQPDETDKSQGKAAMES